MKSGGKTRVVVEWVDGAGTRHLQPPSRVGHERIEEGRPVRGYAFYKGSLGKPGWYYMASVDRHVPYESKLEAWCLLEIDFSADCEAILHQPCRLHFDTTTAPYRHTPDFLFRSRSRARTLVDVKGALASQKPMNASTFSLTRDICEVAGWEFRLAHEPDPTYFQNVRFLGSVRSVVAAAAVDGYARHVTEFVGGHTAIPWGDVAEALASDVPGHLLPRAIARALWTRTIETDLTRPLTEDSILIARATGTHLGAAS